MIHPTSLGKGLFVAVVCGWFFVCLFVLFWGEGCVFFLFCFCFARGCSFTVLSSLHYSFITTADTASRQVGKGKN